MEGRILTGARLAAAEVGIDRCSMSLICSRAGVGKPTVYLRWEDRWAVMVAALEDLPGPPDPDGYQGIVAAAWTAHRHLVTGPYAGFLRAALDASRLEPTLQAAVETTVLSPWRAFLGQVAATQAAADAHPHVDLIMAQLVVAMVRPQEDERSRAFSQWLADVHRQLTRNGPPAPSTAGLSVPPGAVPRIRKAVTTGPSSP
ncbi:MAG: TetR/AcrR family transcriptional regulator [Thermoleophilia bacterium]